MSWQRFLHGFSEEQTQLRVCDALIEDATRDTVLWLQADPSAEERIHVIAMQQTLGDLARIVQKRMYVCYEVTDGWNWAEGVAEVLSRLQKATTVRGNIIGNGLARLQTHLPRELLGAIGPLRPSLPAAREDSEPGIAIVPPSAQNPTEAPPNSPTRLAQGGQAEWRDLQDKFMQLVHEEEEIERATPKDRLLRAYCDYKEHPKVWERGKPEQGLMSLLERPVTGLWTLGDGVSENFQARFRALASRASVLLDCPNGTDPEDFWLHRLYQNLLENNSDQLFAASKEGGVILRVCVASATFCARLESKAIEQSNSASSARQSEVTARSAVSAATQAANSASREQILRPILEKKGFSVHDWAKTAEVDFHTANDYLKGETSPYQSTRKKLADALGIAVEELPA